MSDPKFPVERADLTRLPFRALAVVAKVIESGDRKYQAGDWIMAPQRIDGRRDLNSALRHIAEYVEGKDVDEDSGESPLAHAAARLLFLLEREARGIKGGGWRIGKGEVMTTSPEKAFEELVETVVGWGKPASLPQPFQIEPRMPFNRCPHLWDSPPLGMRLRCVKRSGHAGEHQGGPL